MCMQVRLVATQGWQSSPEGGFQSTSYGGADGADGVDDIYHS